MAELNAAETDWGIVNFITLARIYDMLTIIALSMDKAGTEKLLAAHEQGIIVNAMPSLNVQEETE